jgi:hypothetical protein
MNIDLKSAAIGLALGLVACGGWYAGSTRPVIQKLVEEKAQAVGRANTLEQEKIQYKTAAEHWFAVANAQPQPVSQDPAVAMLNAVRPGLGTVANAAVHALQNAQSSPRTVTPQPQSQPLISTALSDSCGPNGLLISGQCTQCNPALHPGLFPDGSAGCVQ